MSQDEFEMALLAALEGPRGSKIATAIVDAIEPEHDSEHAIDRELIFLLACIEAAKTDAITSREDAVRRRNARDELRAKLIGLVRVILVDMQASDDPEAGESAEVIADAIGVQIGQPN